MLRAILLALDRRISLEGKIFFLTFGEILAIADASDLAQARAVIARRTSEAAAFMALPPLSAVLEIGMIETVGLGAAAAPRVAGGLAGVLVSGGAPVTGRACVVAPAEAERGAAWPDFAAGDIIVSRMMHPAFLPCLRRAGCLVCEIGGWLSHVAILARECEVPMIVGVRGIAEICSAEPLRLHADGRVERLDPIADLAEVSAAQ